MHHLFFESKMRIHIFRCIVSSVTFVILSGCASSPPLKNYVMPDLSKPSARLMINAFPAEASTGQNADVERREISCSKDGEQTNDYSKLADFSHGWQSTPVILPAGIAHFRLSAQTERVACTTYFSADLKPGVSYQTAVYVVQRAFPSGRTCEVDIRDTKTGEALAILMGSPNYSSDYDATRCPSSQSK